VASHLRARGMAPVEDLTCVSVIQTTIKFTYNDRTYVLDVVDTKNSEEESVAGIRVQVRSRRLPHSVGRRLHSISSTHLASVTQESDIRTDILAALDSPEYREEQKRMEEEKKKQQQDAPSADA
jgi:hypothetical protein